ncbi:Hypothetical predicted protein [Octopus vulgaris]|uniref:Uncharacterized protein n=1 Tax=Octopus vulgaris TaxID=6645 RepID=A0AA36F144_OCTVU|nr:Hypothetical predicted protein [Octopus vulgaris]
MSKTSLTLMRQRTEAKEFRLTTSHKQEPLGHKHVVDDRIPDISNAKFGDENTDYTNKGAMEIRSYDISFKLE